MSRFGRISPTISTNGQPELVEVASVRCLGRSPPLLLVPPFVLRVPMATAFTSRWFGSWEPSGSVASTPGMKRDWSRRSIIACLCAASLLGEGDVGPVESTV